MRWFDLVGKVVGRVSEVNQPGPASSWMGDHWQIGKSSRYVTSHPGQLSLVIPPWVGATSTSESWDVSRHIA